MTAAGDLGSRTVWFTMDRGQSGEGWKGPDAACTRPNPISALSSLGMRRFPTPAEALWVANHPDLERLANPLDIRTQLWTGATAVAAPGVSLHSSPSRLRHCAKAKTSY